MDSGRASLLQQARPIAGPGAAAIKYDILTALLVTATCGDPVAARLSLRLSLLITARFNWRRGSFAVGQRELARMWGVTERTAKREMAELRRRGWIVVDVPAARGRVTQYRVALNDLLRATAPHWDAVGPDFAARMSDAPPPTGQGADNVVPLRPGSAPGAASVADDDTGWMAAAVRLKGQDPALYNAWFAPLSPLDLESGILTLSAPTRFIADYVTAHHGARLLAVIVTINPAIRDVRIVEA